MSRGQNSSKLKSEIEELKEFVNESADNTKKQLDSIDNFLLLGSLLSFIIAFWFSYLIDILIYWVPASFLLWVTWSLYSLYKSIRRKGGPKSVEELNQLYRQTNVKLAQLKYAEFLRNSSAVIKSIGIIYLVTFLILIVKENISFNILIPSISAAILACLSFLFDRTVNYVEKEKIEFDLQALKSLNTKQALRLLLGIMTLIIAGFVFMYLLPIWSLYEVRTLYLPIGNNSWLLMLSIIIQAITICVIASYLSSLSARKELTNTLTNYADIDYQISDLLLKNEGKKEDSERLRHLYLTAKRYDMIIDNSFKFINFYQLIANRTYLRNI